MDYQQYFRFDIDLPQEQVVNNVYSHFTGNIYWGITYIETYTNDIGHNVVLLGGIWMRPASRSTLTATLKIIEVTTASVQVILTVRSTAPRHLTDIEVQSIYARIKHFCHTPYVNRVAEFFKHIFGSPQRKEKRS